MIAAICSVVLIFSAISTRQILSKNSRLSAITILVTAIDQVFLPHLLKSRQNESVVTSSPNLRSWEIAYRAGTQLGFDHS